MEKKKSVLYAIVPHCEARKPTGREAVNGQIVDTFNYGGIPAIAIYSRKSAAAKRADRMSRFLGK